MFLKILKKDLVKKKTMNVIMLLFIILASMFMGSSVNNFAVSTTAVNHFFEVANTADIIAIIAGDEKTFEQTDQFLESCDKIRSYGKDLVIMGADNKLFDANGEKLNYGNSDMRIYFTKKPQKYSLIFNTDGKPIEIKDNEIAVPNIFAENTGTKLGDKLIMKFDGFKKEYTIRAITKDAGFGTTLGGTTRIVMSDNDYEEINSYFSVKVAIYHINSDNITEATKAISENIDGLKTTITRDLFKICYIFDVMLAIIMLTVSLLLLLIAFMILRFTIIFTLEDDFKQIGVLKALGLRNRSIRGLYLSKYFALALIGSTLGCIGSIPFGSLLNSSLSNNIIITGTEQFLWINLLCAVFVIIVVVLFCYGCTGKLNRFSAVEAIRCGSKGESYSSISKIKLEKRRKISVPFAMALNDVLGNIRRYLVITVTFFICLLLLILPMIAVETMKNPDSTLKLLGMCTDCVYVYLPDKELVLHGDREYLEDYLKNMEDKLRSNGMEATVSTSAFISVKMEYPNANGTYAINAVMDLNSPESTYQATAGTLPQNQNEFAMSEKALEEFGGKIGDTYKVTIGKESYDLLLTCTYNNMNNIGKTIHIQRDLDVDFSQLSALNPASIFYHGNLTEEQFNSAYERTKKLFSDTTVYNETEYAEAFMGTYIDMFKNVELIATLIVSAVVFLISLLVTRSFIARAIGETALLKSIGFTPYSIRKRHILRIAICLAAATLLMYIVSVPISKAVISLAFSLFGAAGTDAAINPLYVYLIHPAMVLTVIIIAGSLGTIRINKVEPKEVNSIE